MNYSFIINESAVVSTTAVQTHAGNPNIVKFTTVLQEADRPNRNGRIYKKAVLEQALNSPYVQERLRTHSFLGEANHPADSSVQRQMTVDLTNVAFRVNDFFWEGNLLKGHCETLDTAVGRDMAGLIKQGCQVAFSLRAQGNVHQDPITGYTMVDAPIQICSYDWVLNPSHDRSYLLDYCCEETQSAMLYHNRFGSKEMALTEAVNIFNNGELIKTDSAATVINEDYTRSYTTNFKPLSEMYMPEEGDNVVSMNAKETVVENAETHTTKKVLTEDYLVKDIRNKILSLDEGLRDFYLGVKQRHLEKKSNKLNTKLQKTNAEKAKVEHEQEGRKMDKELKSIDKELKGIEKDSNKAFKDGIKALKRE